MCVRLIVRLIPDHTYIVVYSLSLKFISKPMKFEVFIGIASTYGTSIMGNS